MKKRILVPVDNTPVTQDVIKLADFWGQKLDAKLLFLHARNAEIQKLVDRGELINPKEHLFATFLQCELSPLANSQSNGSLTASITSHWRSL